ncbi:MAG: hypothetical protein HQM12_20320, partial [SAR324 cluster bacterium]|nr:hypothetical protein [SAR324 cluster bacterium]
MRQILSLTRLRVLSLTLLFLTAGFFLFRGCADVDQLANFDETNPGIPSHLAWEVELPWGITSESGGVTEAFIKLNEAPTGNVVIQASSDNSAEGSVVNGELVFTPDNWNTFQTVQIAGVD